MGARGIHIDQYPNVGRGGQTKFAAIDEIVIDLGAAVDTDGTVFYAFKSSDDATLKGIEIITSAGQAASGTNYWDITFQTYGGTLVGTAVDTQAGLTAATLEDIGYAEALLPAGSVYQVLFGKNAAAPDLEDGVLIVKVQRNL
jgi:hypothetical protein